MKPNKVWDGTWLEGKEYELIAFSIPDLDKTLVALEQTGREDIRTRILFQISKKEVR